MTNFQGVFKFSDDDSGDGFLNFFDCTMLVDFGPVKAGTKLHAISIDTGTFEIIFYSEDFDVAGFAVPITIAPYIKA